MLQACITAGARERLARIALVKPEKARAVEDNVLRMAQRGQIAEPVSEDRLVAMLEGSGGGSEGRGGGGGGRRSPSSAATCSTTTTGSGEGRGGAGRACVRSLKIWRRLIA